MVFSLMVRTGIYGGNRRRSGPSVETSEPQFRLFTLSLLVFLYRITLTFSRHSEGPGSVVLNTKFPCDTSCKSVRVSLRSQNEQYSVVTSKGRRTETSILSLREERKPTRVTEEVRVLVSLVSYRPLVPTPRSRPSELQSKLERMIDTRVRTRLVECKD